MRMTNFIKSALVATALSSASFAQASILNFDLTGSYEAHWSFDTTVAPTNPIPGHTIEYYPVSGNFPGASDGTAAINFYSLVESGGFTIVDFRSHDIFADSTGAQVYATDTEADPVFNLGTYNFSSDTGNYTLTIADADAAVPEPASAALLLGGLGLMFAAKKRRFGK